MKLAQWFAQWWGAVGAALFVLWALGAYSRLTGLRTDLAQAYGQLHAHLKRRDELLGEFMSFGQAHGVNRELLERVSAARAQAVAASELVRGKPLLPGAMERLSMAQAMLATAVVRLRQALEQDPELSLQAPWQTLQEEWRGVASKGAYAREAYNDQASRYNQAVEQFPARWLARAAGLPRAALLQNEPGAREVPPGEH